MIPAIFINHVSDILGETSTGLSGSQIAQYCAAYAVEFNVDIPYPAYQFPHSLANKRTALRKNLMAFSPEQQYKIIKDLCDLPLFSGNKNIKDLKIKLISRYSHLESLVGDRINETLIEETKHWLGDYPDSLKLYNDALLKFQNNIHQTHCSLYSKQKSLIQSSSFAFSF